MMDKHKPFFYFDLTTRSYEKGVRDENIIPGRSSKGLSAKHPEANYKNAAKRRRKKQCQKNL